MRKTSLAFIAVLLLIVTACGDDATTEPTTADATTATTAGSGDTTAVTTATTEATTGGNDMMGGSYADITVDGTTIRFDASERVFSPIEGVTDITLEDCNPNFFSVGFWVIAYPVDGNGELLMEDDGVNIAGIMSTTIPFEGTDPELLEFEFDIDYSPLGIDARYRAEDGGAFAYEFDGNRVTGTATLDQYGEPVDIAFDIVCAG